jgi:hypothetical protein
MPPFEILAACLGLGESKVLNQEYFPTIIVAHRLQLTTLELEPRWHHRQLETGPKYLDHFRQGPQSCQAGVFILSRDQFFGVADRLARHYSSRQPHAQETHVPRAPADT